MMIHLIAGIIGSAVGYGVGLLLEGHASIMTQYLVTSVIGGAVYIYAFVKIKKLKGEI